METVKRMDVLVAEHDVVFVLTDTRERFGISTYMYG